MINFLFYIILTLVGLIALLLLRRSHNEDIKAWKKFQQWKKNNGLK